MHQHDTTCRYIYTHRDVQVIHLVKQMIDTHSGYISHITTDLVTTIFTSTYTSMRGARET